MCTLSSPKLEEDGKKKKKILNVEEAHLIDRRKENINYQDGAMLRLVTMNEVVGTTLTKFWASGSDWHMTVNRSVDR